MPRSRHRPAPAAPPKPTLAPPGRLLQPVVLVGMMGSGKTAVGKALAARLDVPLRDSDAAIEEAAQATISEIFARDGEAFFRDREAEVIARLLAMGPAIVSTGGGAFMADRNRRAISEVGVSLWLDADLDTLWERVRHKDTRPLLRTANPRQTLADLFGQRVPVYRLADLRLPVVGGDPIDATTERALALLALRPDLMETLP